MSPQEKLEALKLIGKMPRDLTECVDDKQMGGGKETVKTGTEHNNSEASK